MTSREALEKLYNEREVLLGEKVNNKSSNWFESIKHYDIIGEALLEISKDLEVLEILKKHSTRLDDEDWNSNIFNGIDFENLDEDEREIIKEWLENE